MYLLIIGSFAHVGTARFRNRLPGCTVVGEPFCRVTSLAVVWYGRIEIVSAVSLQQILSIATRNRKMVQYSTESHS